MKYPIGAWNLDGLERSIIKNGSKINYIPLSCEVDSLGYSTVLIDVEGRGEVLRRGTVANNGAPSRWKIQISLLGVKVVLPLEI